MGFFGKLFSAGPAMNRLAKACDETLNCLRRFDFTGDKDELYKAAWIFTYGVQMSLEKWNWNPFTTKVFIPNHPEFGRIALNYKIPCSGVISRPAASTSCRSFFITSAGIHLRSTLTVRTRLRLRTMSIGA